MLASRFQNRDLVWTLGGKKFSESTFGFLKRFEASLCLFSNTVSQLYSNYEIVHFGHGGTKLVALPNQFAAHDTFNNVDAEAVESTGLYIVPSEISKSCAGVNGLLLLYRCRKNGKLKTMPLAEGMEKIKRYYLPNEPFLPVMLNRDLRSFKGGVPAMHLHRLATDKMFELSKLQINDISATVNNKMQALYSS